jgi:oligopeptide/dipeptide ABC transporter ATP-binding protein
LITPPPGCPFAPRCPSAFDACVKTPPLKEISPGHTAACWLEVDPAPLEKAL